MLNNLFPNSSSTDSPYLANDLLLNSRPISKRIAFDFPIAPIEYRTFQTDMNQICVPIENTCLHEQSNQKDVYHQIHATIFSLTSFHDLLIPHEFPDNLMPCDFGQFQKKNVVPDLADRKSYELRFVDILHKRIEPRSSQ